MFHPQKPPAFWDPALKALDRYCEDGVGLILSDEDMSIADFHGDDWATFESFLLDRFRLKAAVAYRRYHEWLPSVYNQQYKLVGHFHFEIQEWPDQGGIETPTFPSFFDQLLNGTLWRDRAAFGMLYDDLGHVTHPFLRSRRYFEEAGIDVKMLNFHDDEFVNSFVCGMVPGAHETCRAVQKSDRGKQKRNPSEAHHYDILAVAAYRMGLIKQSLDRRDTANAIKEWHENVRGLSAADFPSICLSPANEKRLRDMSLAYEREAFASSSRDAAALDSDHIASFAKAAGKGLFCSVDAELALKDESLRTFVAEL